MKDLLRIASLLDNLGQFILSDKLFKIAQQGRLNLDKQTGIQDFRNELKSLIQQSLVRDNLLEKEYYTGNPLNFHIDYKKLNSLLQKSFLKFYVDYIGNVKEVYPDYYRSGLKVPEAVYYNKKIWIPAEYSSKNLPIFLHEVVHSIDPRFIYNKDRLRPYYNRRSERLAHFEQLYDFFETEKIKKVLEIFYVKNKKKYPTSELAIKSFLDDLKNYLQNPSESMFFNPSRFHSYLLAVNENSNSSIINELLENNYKPLNEVESNKLYGDVDPMSDKGKQLLKDFLKKHPERKESRDVHYFRQLSKFFTNVYTKVSNEIMPSYKPQTKPFNLSTTIKSEASKDWLVKYVSKLAKAPHETTAKALDYIIYYKRDLYNKFISTLRTLNVVLDETFNFQDPRWLVLEPIVEIFLNEFIKYLENPQAYKSSMKVDFKAVEQSINPYKAWQELVLSYKQKYKTPNAILAAFKKNNPTVSIQVPNFASGQIFDKPFSMGNQTSKPFNQLDAKVQEKIIFMINNNGALPPGNDDTPNMSLNELNKLKNQQ